MNNDTDDKSYYCDWVLEAIAKRIIAVEEAANPSTRHTVPRLKYDHNAMIYVLRKYLHTIKPDHETNSKFLEEYDEPNE